MSDDRTDQIRARLEAATPGPWHAWDRGVGWVIALDPSGDRRLPDGLRTDLGRREDAEFIAHAPADIAHLLAENAELRQNGPWVQHVERMRAMKRERDGDCICNTGPDLDGPDEECPWHGRSYQEWIERGNQLAAERDALKAELDKLHSWGGLMALLDEHWPDDVFGSGALTGDRVKDCGVRLVAAMRWIDQTKARADRLAAQVQAVREIIDGLVAQLTAALGEG